MWSHKQTIRRGEQRLWWCVLFYALFADIPDNPRLVSAAEKYILRLLEFQSVCLAYWRQVFLQWNLTRWSMEKSFERPKELLWESGQNWYFLEWHFDPLLPSLRHIFIGWHNEKVYIWQLNSNNFRSSHFAAELQGLPKYFDNKDFHLHSFNQT